MAFENEVGIRLGFFFGVLIFMALWELFAPRRKLTVSKAKRWTSNLAIVVLNSLILRVLFPAAAVGAALFVETKGWGVLPLLSLPSWALIALSVLILDLFIYGQHVIVHAIPLFWRIHRMHHMDLDIDVTTGNRFHPLEIILSMIIKFGVIAMFGMPAVAVIIFEVVLNATSMFNHSNVYLPKIVDRVLRLIVVTPDMHRVHHSVIVNETNSNFGFNFPWWDRMFGTYIDQPVKGHLKMKIGISSFRNKKWCVGLWGMIKSPILAVKGYALNRRD
jgi:sterol desaturase/sphingolipid hydroxylase (fatty acid hydroxylase superfamily)